MSNYVLKQILGKIPPSALTTDDVNVELDKEPVPRDSDIPSRKTQ